jgi:hypothetical protein
VEGRRERGEEKKEKSARQFRFGKRGELTSSNGRGSARIKSASLNDSSEGEGGEDGVGEHG